MAESIGGSSSSTTGFAIMRSPSQTQMDRMKKEQEKSDAASRRLHGDFDAYSSRAGTAAIGLQGEVLNNQYTEEQKTTEKILLKQTQMDDQIKRASNINTNLRNYLYSLRDATSSNVGAIKETITGFSNAFIGVLNENFGGTFVLGGDKSLTPPVNVETATESLSSGTSIDYDYYEGGTSSETLVISGVSIDKFPVTANDPAFATTLTVLRLMSNDGLTQDPQDPILLEAIKIMDDNKSLYAQAIQKSATNTKEVQRASDQLKAALSKTQETTKSALGTNEYDDIVAQMTAAHRLDIQRSLIEDRLNNIRNMLNRMG